MMRLCLSCLVRRSNTKLLVILLVICIVSIVVLLSYWVMLVSSMRSTDRRYIFEDSYHADDGAGDQDVVMHASDPIVDVRPPSIVRVNVTTIAIGCAITTHHEDELSLENLAYQLPFLKTLVPSFCRTASAGYRYLFYISFDSRDPHLGRQEYLVGIHARFTEIVNLLCPRKSKVTLHYVQCRHNGNPTWAQNDAMMEAYLDNVDYYYRVNDDTQMLSPGWTETFIDGLQGFSPSNVGVVGPLHKGGNEAILTYDFVHRTHIDIFGYYYPRVFTDWWADNWMTMVYGPMRTLKLPSVRLLHTGEAGTRYEVKKNKEAFLKEQVEEDQTTLNRYLLAIERARSAHAPSPRSPSALRRVISMSLWGAKTRYTFGALRNAQLARVYYPGWTLRFYVERLHADGSTNFSPTPERLLAKLEQLGAELVSVDAERSRVPPMMWRFLVADDTEVDAFIVRDSDCRLSDRDATVVNEWLASSSPYHCIRDHPSHERYPVLGGLWGGRPQALSKIIAIPWRDLMMGHRSDYAQDMNFLANAIWPKVSEKAICHDSVSCGKWKPSARPFPVERIGTEHLGQVFDAFGNVHDEDIQILLDHRPVKECTVEGNKTIATTTTTIHQLFTFQVGQTSSTVDSTNSSLMPADIKHALHGVQDGPGRRSSDGQNYISQGMPEIDRNANYKSDTPTEQVPNPEIFTSPLVSDVKLRNEALGNNRDELSGVADIVAERNVAAVVYGGVKNMQSGSVEAGIEKLNRSESVWLNKSFQEVSYKNATGGEGGIGREGQDSKILVAGNTMVTTDSELDNRFSVGRNGHGSLGQGNRNSARTHPEFDNRLGEGGNGHGSSGQGNRSIARMHPSNTIQTNNIQTGKNDIIMPSDETSPSGDVVVWSMDYHTGPLRAVKSVVPTNVRFIDKSLAAGCSRYDTCARDLRVITRANGLDLTPALIDLFHEEYETDPEMMLTTHFLCTYPVAVCQLYISFGRPIVMYVNSRYEQCHYTGARWTRWNRIVAQLFADTNNRLVAGNLYDARYVQYFTGILPRVIPLHCAYINAPPVRNRNATNFTVLLSAVHNPAFSDSFRQKFQQASRQTLTLSDSATGASGADLGSVMAVIHIPRQASTTDFCEHYASNIPIFVPSIELAIRWHRRYGILSRLTWNSVRALVRGRDVEEKVTMNGSVATEVGSPISAAAGFENIPDPNRITDDATLRYWLPLTDFYQRANVTVFSSITDLVSLLSSVDLAAVAGTMALENKRTKSSVLDEWRRIFRRTL